MSKAVSKARRGAARAFDVLMPKRCNVPADLVLAAGNYVRMAGNVPALLVATRLHGGSIGVHAAGKGEAQTLCRVPVESATKDATPKTYAAGKASNAAVIGAVTCRYCETRLVAAGLKPAEQASEYARKYGSVPAEQALAAIAEREQAAIAAARKASEQASKPRRTSKPAAPSKPRARRATKAGA